MVGLTAGLWNLPFRTQLKRWAGRDSHPTSPFLAPAPPASAPQWGRACAWAPASRTARLLWKPQKEAASADLAVSCTEARAWSCRIRSASGWETSAGPCSVTPTGPGQSTARVRVSGRGMACGGLGAGFAVARFCPALKWRSRLQLVLRSAGSALEERPSRGLGRGLGLDNSRPVSPTGPELAVLRPVGRTVSRAAEVAPAFFKN